MEATSCISASIKDPTFSKVSDTECNHANCSSSEVLTFLYQYFNGNATRVLCAQELVYIFHNKYRKTDKLMFVIVLFWTYLISRIPLKTPLFSPHCLRCNLQYSSFMLMQGCSVFLARITRHTESNSAGGRNSFSHISNFWIHPLIWQGD